MIFKENALKVMPVDIKHSRPQALTTKYENGS